MLNTQTFSQPMANDQEGVAQIPGGYPACAPDASGHYPKRDFDQKFGQYFATNYDAYASEGVIPGSVNDDRMKSILQNIFANANPRVDPQELAQALADYWHTVSVKPGTPAHGGVAVVSVRNDALQKVHLFREAIDFSLTTVGQHDWYETFANNVQRIAVEELEWEVVETMPLGVNQTFIEKMPRTSRPATNLGGSEIPIPPDPPPYPEDLPPITPNPGAGSGDIDQTLFAWAASELNVGEAIIRAIADVESGAHGPYGPDGRPTIRHERHWAYKLLKRQGLEHFASTGTVENPVAIHPKSLVEKTNQDREYRKQDYVSKFSQNVAYQSCSWGMFQLMGFNYNYCGFSTVESFVRAMYDSVNEQFKAFVLLSKNDPRRDPIYNDKLLANIQKKQWRGIASLYNGPNYAAGKYHTKIENAYHQYVAQGYSP